MDSGIRATHREFGGRVKPGFTVVVDERGNGTFHVVNEPID